MADKEQKNQSLKSPPTSPEQLEKPAVKQETAKPEPLVTPKTENKPQQPQAPQPPQQKEKAPQPTPAKPIPAKKEQIPEEPPVKSTQPSQKPPQTQTQAQAAAQKAKEKKPEDKAKKNKRIITGCLSTFGCAIILFMVVAFIFISQETTTESVIARMLNVSFTTLKNTLILILNVLFSVLAFASFIVAIIGMFKVAMSKKEDKVGKKKGVMYGVIGTIVLFLSVFGLIIIIKYFPVTSGEDIPPQKIVTDPEETLNLTAPITIKFDASNLRPQSNTQILSYNWDFDDGESDTGQIVVHEYTDKDSDGRYIVTLTVKSKNTKTDEEFEDSLSVDVTIANVKPTAIIEVDNESGDAPLVVNFDASKSEDPDGEIVSFDWDLDEDGLFDDESGEKFEYTFEDVGKYVVALRVTDTKDEYTILEQEIEVLEENVPKAVIKYEPEDERLMVNQGYLFSGEDSSFEDSTIVKYMWDFGDGTTEETESISHTYTTPGFYKVTLKVEEEGGKIGETSEKIEVVSSETAPRAEITASPGVSNGKIKGEAPLEISFDGSASTDPDNNIINYEWDFENDGTIDQVAKNTSKVFENPGTYEVVLKVSDADDNISQTSIIVEVEAQALQVSLEAEPVQGEVPLEVSFDASGSTYPEGEIVAYEWDFGDGTSPRIDNSSLTYRYNKVGTYTARVTAIASDNSRAFKEVTVTVREIALSACFETNKKQGKAPLTVAFDPACSRGTISKFLWDFGGLETSRTREPIYTFEDPGTYKVVLEIEDNSGVIDTFEMDIIVNQ